MAVGMGGLGIVAVLAVAVLLLAVLAVIAVVGVRMYNLLVGKKNMVENLFAGIDVVLKKRCDLIPNLVASVQQYMQHEKGLLTEVTALRAQATSGNLSGDERVAVENKLGRAIGGIMVAVERYPDLKANQNVMQLQQELRAVEGEIAGARTGYNAAVTDYNNTVEMFPTNLLAGLIGYRRKQLFEASEADRQNPSVKQLFNA